jgi:hypothetical protein
MAMMETVRNAVGMFRSWDLAIDLSTSEGLFIMDRKATHVKPKFATTVG